MDADHSRTGPHARPRKVELQRRIVGAGEPIVLVHGSAADAASFRLLEPFLAEQFTVVSVERRGRCGSADEDEYTLEAEFDDLVGVVEALQEPAIVFGHSFGGNVALGAALRSSMISKLILYEPGRRGDAPRALRDELDRLLERSEWRAAMRLVLRYFTRFPEEWLDDLLDTPPWQERLVYAHTLGRELRAYEEYDYGDLSRLSTPTLFLVGSESPAEELEYAQLLSAALPSARMVVLPEQGHLAPVTAPALVAREIAAFADERALR